MGSCRILVKSNSILVKKLFKQFYLSGHNDIDCKRLRWTGQTTKHDLMVFIKGWLLSSPLLKKWINSKLFKLWPINLATLPHSICEHFKKSPCRVCQHWHNYGNRVLTAIVLNLLFSYSKGYFPVNHWIIAFHLI